MGDMLPVLATLLTMGVLVLSVRACLRPLQRRMDRLSRIEGKLDAILKHLGVSFDAFEGLPAEVLEAVRQGRKIEAIKRYRHATGVGLQEAKDVIEEALRHTVSS